MDDAPVELDAVHATEICPLPRVPTTLVGADGPTAGVTATVVAAAPAPAWLVAVIEKV